MPCFGIGHVILGLILCIMILKLIGRIFFFRRMRYPGLGPGLGRCYGTPRVCACRGRSCDKDETATSTQASQAHNMTEVTPPQTPGESALK